MKVEHSEFQVLQMTCLVTQWVVNNMHRLCSCNAFWFIIDTFFFSLPLRKDPILTRNVQRETQSHQRNRAWENIIISSSNVTFANKQPVLHADIMALTPAAEDRKQRRDGQGRWRMAAGKKNWSNLGWNNVSRWHRFLCLLKGFCV